MTSDDDVVGVSSSPSFAAAVVRAPVPYSGFILKPLVGRASVLFGRVSLVPLPLLLRGDRRIVIFGRFGREALCARLSNRTLVIRVLRVLRMIRLAIRLVVRRERVRELVVRGVLARTGERREERLVRVARAHRGDGVIVVVVVVVRRGGSVGVNAVVARFRRGARAGAFVVSTSAATADRRDRPFLRAEPPAAATGVPALPRARGGLLLAGPPPADEASREAFASRSGGSRLVRCGANAPAAASRRPEIAIWRNAFRYPVGDHSSASSSHTTPRVSDGGHDDVAHARVVGALPRAADLGRAASAATASRGDQARCGGRLGGPALNPRRVRGRDPGADGPGALDEGSLP